MLNYNDVYVLEIDGSHWEGRKEKLLQILNNYKDISERESAEFNFIFLPLRDYNKLRYLNSLS